MFCAELYRIGLKAELRRLICGAEEELLCTNLGRLMARFVLQSKPPSVSGLVWQAPRYLAGVACHEIPPVSRHDRTLLAHSLNRFLYLSTDELMCIAEDLTKIHIFK
jgi:hypothetical protein